jgi:AcrR family transcriptional regulator
MPPKPKFTREEMIEAAVEIVRREGEDALTARNLGSYLGASARPIFTVFESMDEVREAVKERAHEIFMKYREKMCDELGYPRYKAIGKAYIRFACEEKMLFRLLFMCERPREGMEEKEGYDAQVRQIIEEQTGFSEEKGSLFHVENWIFVHGIATMMATSYFQWDDALVDRMLSDVYAGLKMRHLQDEEELEREKRELEKIKKAYDESHSKH